MNSQEGDTMAEDTTTPDVIEDDIADVSLTDTPDIVADSTTESGDTAEQAEEGADTQTDVEAEPEKAPDAAATADDSQESNEQPATPSKTERDQAAARAWQERQRQRQQVAQQLDEAYGPKSPDELVQEGLPPAEAQIEALRQEMAYKEQRTQIAELNASMVTEATEVMSDMPIFRAENPDGTPNPDYDPQFAQAVEQQYRMASRLETDDNGIILNAEVPIYDFYKQAYDTYQSALNRGVQRGQEMAQSMISRTENPGGSSSTNGNSSNDLDALEERLGNVRIA